MLSHYIEIKLLHTPDIDLGFLWGKVFTQLHLALVEHKKSSIGVSFPEYCAKSFSIGSTVRLFAGTEKGLKDIDVQEKMERLKDYAVISEIQKVPENVKGHAFFSRKNMSKKVRSSKEALARRFAKRHGISYEEALMGYSKEEWGKPGDILPWIELRSLSQKIPMKIYIQKTQADKEVVGKFNTYGLSKTATVPIF